MKLLFITQKADKNDDVLGVYHRWIEGQAARCEKVTVICLYQGKTNFPANVTVYSLGKEAGRRTRFQYAVRFLSLIWKLRKDYDRVLVHMNPEYVLLGGLFWRLTGKKIVLWYAHYLANWRIRLAAMLANRIVTSTRRAFPFASRKLLVLQQGIDTDLFAPIEHRFNAGRLPLKILFLGRISPVKNLDVLLRAFQLASDRTEIELSIVGGPTPGKASEADYFERMKKLAEDLGLAGKVRFRAPVPNFQTPAVYGEHDLFVNLTVSGSFDKSTLEAMACGLPILVSNLAFRDVLTPELQDQLMFPENDYGALAAKIAAIAGLSEGERQKIGGGLREIIVAKHGLNDLMDKLNKAILSI